MDPMVAGPPQRALLDGGGPAEGHHELGQPARDTVLRGLESKAHVKVDVTYGSWDPPSATSLASVVAPSASPATPVGTPGALISSGASLGT